MKVLYVEPCPDKGGSQISLRNLIQSFPPGTVDPLVCCPEGSAQKIFELAGIPVMPVDHIATFGNGRTTPLSGINFWRIYRALLTGYQKKFLEAIKKFSPDIIHLNDCHLIEPLKIAKSQEKKVVVHARFTLSRSPSWAWQYQTGALRKYADKIIAIDKSVLRTLGDQERAVVVYNPLNRDFPEVPPRDLVLSAEKSFSKSNPLRVGFVSLFYPQKGVLDLLEAARLLKEKREISFVLCGGNGRPASFYQSFFGKTCDFLGVAPNMEKRMQKFIAKHELKNVQLFGFMDNVLDVFQSLDILVFPSWLDAVPRSVYEAGALGVPSIVAMENKVEDIVRDGENGFVVPQQDPPALAKTLLTILDKPELLRVLGENARRQFSEQFSGARAARDVLAVYRELQGEL